MPTMHFVVWSYSETYSSFIALKSPVWGCPICILWGGVQESFGHNLLSCGWLWLTSFMGQLLFAFGLNLCLLSSHRLPVPERGFQYKQQFFHWFLKYHLEGTTEIYKEIHVGLKLEWSLYDKYWWSWKCLLFGVFFSHPLKLCAEWLMQTQQWPLSDHSSMHCIW